MVMKSTAIILLALLASASAFSVLPTAILVKSLQSKASISITTPFYTTDSSSKLYASVAIDSAEQPTSGGSATVSSEIFNLVKGIVGAGVLSLPAGEL
jgi:hypothetical protein